MPRTALLWTSLQQFPGGWKMCTSLIVGTSQIAIKKSLNSQKVPPEQEEEIYCEGDSAWEYAAQTG